MQSNIWSWCAVLSLMKIKVKDEKLSSDLNEMKILSYQLTMIAKKDTSFSYFSDKSVVESVVGFIQEHVVSHVSC